MSLWNKITSPPQNLLNYKLSDNSADQHKIYRDVNIDENRTTLFQPKIKEEKQKNTPQESLFNHIGDALSFNTSQKDPSSLKTTTKGKSNNHESTFDLKMRGKNQGHKRQQSKSMLDNKKQKSSVNLSHKIQSSSVIREEGSRVSTSSKNGRSFLKRINNEEEESFSRILAEEASVEGILGGDKQNIVSMNSTCLY